MNNKTTTETETETKAASLPFPANVNEACPNEAARALNETLMETAKDTSNVLDSAGNVHFYVRPHYVNLATGVYGIESLICDILTERQAIFPARAENTELRPVVVAASLYASEIIEEVQRRAFGTERYTYETIHHYLSYKMSGKLKGHAAKVHGFKLTKSEDSERKCNKPRLKWYLLTDADTKGKAATADTR